MYSFLTWYLLTSLIERRLTKKIQNMTLKRSSQQQQQQQQLQQQQDRHNNG